MKKILLVRLLAVSLTGCLKKDTEEEKIVTEKVTIKNGCYYYLKAGNTTIYDIYCSNYDKNSNGIIIVSYEMDGVSANILKIEDDITR